MTKKLLFLAGSAVAVLGVMFLAQRTVVLQERLDAAKEQVKVMSMDKIATDEVLIKYGKVREEIESAKEKRERDFENAMCFTGDDRIDALLKLLDEDYSERCDKTPDGSAAKVQGAGRQ